MRDDGGSLGKYRAVWATRHFRMKRDAARNRAMIRRYARGALLYDFVAVHLQIPRGEDVVQAQHIEVLAIGAMAAAAGHDAGVVHMLLEEASGFAGPPVVEIAEQD